MNRIKELRKEKGLKQTELAAILNVTQGALSSWETGRYDIGNDDLKKLADFFDVSADYILGRDDITKLSGYIGKIVENKKIPIIGSVKCGPNGLAFEDIEGYVNVDDDLTGEIFALRCKGDSMKFEDIKEGDIAIVRRQDDVECGELAVVIINGDEGTLKKVRKFEGGIILEAANPDYPPRIFTGEDLRKIKIVGKVLETRRKR